MTGELPVVPKAILIGAPHTSNWDFPICMLAMFATGLRITWLAKHTLFFFPAAPILRWMGGEPVDRRVHADRVRHAISRFAERPQWWLGIAPEGTRRPVPAWHTGFWHIAHGAGVPIIPIVIDWSVRQLRITDPLIPGDDEAADLALIRTRYHSRMARRPAGFVDAR